MPDHPLGPNGRFVDRFLRRVAAMDALDVECAVQAWREAQRAASAPARGDWVAAEEAAAATLARTRRVEAAWRLQDRVHDELRRAHRRARAGADVRSAATAEYLVATAAVALLLADALPPRHLARLYAPFVGLVPLAELTAPTADQRHVSPTHARAACAVRPGALNEGGAPR